MLAQACMHTKGLCMGCVCRGRGGGLSPWSGPAQSADQHQAVNQGLGTPAPYHWFFKHGQRIMTRLPVGC